MTTLRAAKFLHVAILPVVLLSLTRCAMFEPREEPQTSRSARGQAAKKVARKNAKKKPAPKAPQPEPKPIPDPVDGIEALTIDDVVTKEEPSTQSLYDNSRYDFPITVNSKVEGWMDYFTGRGRRHFERYLGRSSRYISNHETNLAVGRSTGRLGLSRYD